MPENLRAHVIYEFQCPGCKAKYIGKTDRCLGLRLDEHLHAETSAIGKHLNECEHFHFIVNLYNISVFSDLDQAVIQHYYHIHAAVLQNTRIIDKITTGLSFVSLNHYTSREGIPRSMSASKLLKNLFFSGDFNTFPFVSVVYFSAVKLITFVRSLTIQHTAVHVFHSLLINSCFDRILPL